MKRTAVLLLMMGCASTRPATYAESQHSREWQALLPEELRFDDAVAPVEEWWPWRGGRVHLDRLRAAGESRNALVILVHGAAGHGRLLMPLAVELARAGYETLAPDLPGYGLTDLPPSTAMTLPLWIDLIVELAAVERARTGRHVVVYGLSIGGTVAFHAAAASPDVDAVMTTTLLDLRDEATRLAISSSPALTSFGLWLNSGGCFDGMRLPLAWAAPLGKMTDDPRILEHYRKDPFIPPDVPMGFWRSMGSTAPAVEPEAFFKPLLLAHPGADAWTPVALSRPLFDRLAGPKELLVLSSGSHLPLESPAWAELSRATRAFLDRSFPAP